MQYKQDAAYIRLYPLILNAEGGYVDHPNDPGGPTNHGIAWSFNQAALQKIGITRATMRNLTKEQAIQIYYEKYWLAAHCHRLHDLPLQYIHFDAAVNHGVGAARLFKMRLPRNPEHFIGNGSNRALFLELFLHYYAQRLRAYNTDRNRATFLGGWINRLLKVEENARGMRS